MNKPSSNLEPGNALSAPMSRRQFLGLGALVFIGGCVVKKLEKVSGLLGRDVSQSIEEQAQSTRGAAGSVLDETSRKEDDNKALLEAKLEKSRELLAKLLGIYNETLRRIEVAEADSENGLDERRPYAASMARRLPSALTNDFDRARKALTDLLTHFGEPGDFLSESGSWSRLALTEAQELACLLSAMAYDVGGIPAESDDWMGHDEYLKKGDTRNVGADEFTGDGPDAAGHVIVAQRVRAYEDLMSSVSRIKAWNSMVTVESPRIESLKRQQRLLRHAEARRTRPAKGHDAFPSQRRLDHRHAERARRKSDLRVADARIDEMSVEALQLDIAKRERDLRWLRDMSIPKKKRVLREAHIDQFDPKFMALQAEIARDEKQVRASERWIAHCKEKLQAKIAKAVAKGHK